MEKVSLHNPQKQREQEQKQRALKQRIAEDIERLKKERTRVKPPEPDVKDLLEPEPEIEQAINEIFARGCSNYGSLEDWERQIFSFEEASLALHATKTELYKSEFNKGIEIAEKILDKLDWKVQKLENADLTKLTDSDIKRRNAIVKDRDNLHTFLQICSSFTNELVEVIKELTVKVYSEKFFKIKERQKKNYYRQWLAEELKQRQLDAQQDIEMSELTIKLLARNKNLVIENQILRAKIEYLEQENKKDKCMNSSNQR